MVSILRKAFVFHVDEQEQFLRREEMANDEVSLVAFVCPNVHRRVAGFCSENLHPEMTCVIATDISLAKASVMTTPAVGDKEAASVFIQTTSASGRVSNMG